MTLDLDYFTCGPRGRVLQSVVDAGHNVRRVVAGDPDVWPRVRQSIELSERLGIPVEIVRKRDLPGLIPSIAGRLVLSVGFGYLFPAALIDAAWLIVNVHGTLLPKYAGARSLNWIIEQGERASGVTVHRVDEGMDTGPILLQRSFAVERFDTVRSLARKTAEFEPGVVTDALALIGSGHAEFHPQSHVGVRQFPNRVPEHSLVDATRPLTELFDAIRACDDERFPAYFFVDGEKVVIRLQRSDRAGVPEDLI